MREPSNAPTKRAFADAEDHFDPELKEWLAHKHFSGTRHHAVILRHRLTAAYRKADCFARNVRTIQVLVDREPILFKWDGSTRVRGVLQLSQG